MVEHEPSKLAVEGSTPSVRSTGARVHGIRVFSAPGEAENFLVDMCTNRLSIRAQIEAQVRMIRDANPSNDLALMRAQLISDIDAIIAAELAN